METWGNKVKKALSRLGKTDNYLYNKPEQDWTQKDKALVIAFLRKSKVAENTQMEDLKKVQEFFSKPLEEISNDYSPLSYAKLVATGKMEIEDAMKETGFSYVLLKQLVDKVKGAAQNLREELSLGDTIKINPASFPSFEFPYGTEGEIIDISKADYASDDLVYRVKLRYIDGQGDEANTLYIENSNQYLNEQEEDPTDIIAMDVPLFLRMLEWAKEDAAEDVDLHEVTERAIEAVKLRGLLSMDDYDSLIGETQQVDEVRLIPKDQIEALAAKLAAQIFSKRQDNKPAVDILKKALEDAYRALDPNVEIKEEEGYSKYLKDDPEFPGGKTKGLTPDVLNKILMKIANVDDIDETIRLGENVIYEELCPKGKEYIKKRQAAGEKSSAYLSGRAVKVCKGQMKG